MSEFGYKRIVEAFDEDDTAAAFLSDDGEGGFASGVYRMAREIRHLRRALNKSPCPFPLDKAEDKTVAACIAAGVCGCENGSLLSPNCDSKK